MRLQLSPGKEFLYFLGGTLALLWSGVAIVSHLHFKSLQREQFQDLKLRAELAAARLGDDIQEGDTALMESRVNELAGLVFDRIMMTAPDGTVRYRYPESGFDWTRAAAGGAEDGTRERFEPLAVFTAEATTPDGGTLQVSRYDPSLMERHRDFRAAVQRWTLFGYLLFAAGGLAISRRRARSSRMLLDASAALFGGDYNVRVPVPEHPDFQPLARNINQIAAGFGERLAGVRGERDRLRTLFGALSDPVFAVDNDEKLIDLNRAAARFFKAPPQSARGRTLAQVVRQPELNQFVRDVLRTAQPDERELTLFLEGKERLLSVSGAPFALAADNDGALFLLRDTTDMRRLESHRSDFVANVSHELRTPITSIKGYSETLLAGALNDPEHATRFLEKILHQSDRLFQLIEDLLSLSRLENGPGDAAGRREPLSLEILLESASMQCAPRAERCGVQVRIRVEPEDLQAVGNPNLLEQAVVNLLDNAIKYSPRDGVVQVVARRDGDQVRVEVVDNGPGIAAEHHERLFERFYLVDKARSQALGGTGLGLSIVKHIMMLHHGAVSVQSAPGQGSTFSLTWPVGQPDREDSSPEQSPLKTAVFS